MGGSSVTYGLCGWAKTRDRLSSKNQTNCGRLPLPLTVRRRVPSHKTPSHDHAGQVSRRFEVALLVCPP